ncbi:MAG: hypothetical protein KDA37_04415 [Planctomycetales bacterium]|nr:hypothetical protein [Planctomycetales bacterium]
MVVFQIPFAPPADVYPRAVEVQLYVSDDGGRNWNLISRADPGQKHFTFRAPRDGDYWFSVRTLNEAGQVTPTTRPRPELHVVVDTVAPKMKLRTWRSDSGELHAAWELNEPNLRGDSLKLMYNTGGTNERWQPITISPAPTVPGQAAGERETTWQAVAEADKYFVRAEVTDQAGNTFVTEQEVVSCSQLAATPQQSPAPVEELSAPAPEIIATAEPATQTWSPESPGDVGATPPPAMANTFPASSTPQASNVPAGLASQQNQTAVSTEELPPPTAAAPTTSLVSNAPMSPPVANIQSATAELTPPGNVSGAPDPITLAGLPEGVRPRMVNSRRFELEYDVESVGPTGIGRVELWGTRTGGQSWLNFGAPPDQRNPLQVTVDGEGIYGFRIVVYSGSGLGGIPPKRGDLPDVWLGVDLTSPDAKILSAEQGTDSRAGELLVSWEASDRLLADRPISLSFSSQPEGPWSTLAASLPNTGAYVWRLDNRVPDIVYLRMEVRDEAGNVQTVDYGQPISIYRQRPAGRIINVRPVTVADSTR